MEIVILHGVPEKLVYLGNLARDANVDSSVVDFHNQSSDDVRVDLYVMLVDWRRLCLQE